MNQLKEAFLQASPREQLIISLGGGLLVIVLLFMFVLVPAQKKRDAQLRINASALNEKQQVRELAAQVLAQAQNPNAGAGGSLIDLLNRSLPKYELHMEDFQPSGAGDARVRLAKADLNKIFSWLNELENVEGVQVKDLSAATGPETGSAVVNLRLHKD